jgi:glucose/mannose-6-phosphate isomerase
VDSQGLVNESARLPEQLLKARVDFYEERGALSTLEGATGDAIGSIVIAGMGGSACAGEIAVAGSGAALRIPVEIWRGYGLPAWAGKETLLVAVSFSGATEETISAWELAAERGMTRVAVTSGGKLAALAHQEKCPLLHVDPSIPQPRAALGAMTAPLLGVLTMTGAIENSHRVLEQDLEEAVAVMQARRQEIYAKNDGIWMLSPNQENVAHKAAQALQGALALAYGAEGPGAAAAHRFKTQVNENAKSPAWWSALPELCHNELAGWERLGEVTSQWMSLLCFREAQAHEEKGVSRRFEWVMKSLQGTVREIVELRGEGASPLARLFDLIFQADAISLYLALERGLDPGPIPALAALKEWLALSESPAQPAGSDTEG